MAVIIAVLAFGYFVDLLDAGLLGAVRVASLTELGVAPADLLAKGVFLYNMQLTGMIFGGIAWGMIGDKFGRTTILFGSIATYAVANLCNALVSSVEVYGFLRLLSGFGLAGELGGAVTFLSEVLSRNRRGLGTTLVIAIGGLGSISAGFIGDHLHWRHCYLLGGGLGASLLLARLVIFESELFRQMASKVPRPERGSLRLLVTSPSRLKVLLCNASLGLPIYFLVAVLVVFLPELAVDLGVNGQVTVGRAAMFHYAGKATGSLITGFLSHRVGSHKKVIRLALIGVGLGLALFFSLRGPSPALVYSFFLALGLMAGYWGIFMVMVAEQFGTNLRATVVSSVPSLARGGAILMTMLLELGHGQISLVWLMAAEGLGVIGLALLCLRTLKESYGRRLDFCEGDVRLVGQELRR